MRSTRSAGGPKAQNSRRLGAPPARRAAARPGCASGDGIRIGPILPLSGGKSLGGRRIGGSRKDAKIAKANGQGKRILEVFLLGVLCGLARYCCESHVNPRGFVGLLEARTRKTHLPDERTPGRANATQASFDPVAEVRKNRMSLRLAREHQRSDGRRGGGIGASHACLSVRGGFVYSYI